jgi:dephospho-CoA kinase
MIRLGLTGSIGMGKSTTARMFWEAGAALWDADAAVHRLYAKGGAATGAIARLEPEAVIDGAVDRERLRAAVLADADLLPRIEAAVHPLVRADRDAFLAQAAAEGRAVAVCDVPLLFETGAEDDFDAVAVVSAEARTQRERVLARPGMTAEAFEAILARQVPDAEKRARADYVVETDDGLESAREQVAAIMRDLEKRAAR